MGSKAKKEGVSMEYLYIGKIVNTHGIKGEVKILSDFLYKDKVFYKGKNIYIGHQKNKEVIATYRVHKNFDMITMSGYDNINQVLKYKGSKVYILKQDLQLDPEQHLDSDYVGMSVMVDEKEVGKVVRIERYPTNQLIVVNNGEKDFLIPFIDDIILNVVFETNVITIKNIKGLFP